MTKAILLIGGASNTGKTAATNFIAQELIKNGYNLVQSQPTGYPSIDMLYLLQGNDNKGIPVDIVINTAADDDMSINNFDSFLQQFPCDIIVTAVRSFGAERTGIFNVTKKYKTANCLELEIPLAKITQRIQNKNVAMNWYTQRIENLSKHILKSYPFDLKI